VHGRLRSLLVLLAFGTGLAAAWLVEALEATLHAYAHSIATGHDGHGFMGHEGNGLSGYEGHGMPGHGVPGHGMPAHAEHGMSTMSFVAPSAPPRALAAAAEWLAATAPAPMPFVGSAVHAEVSGTLLPALAPAGQ
jgi:hypothetical protein